MGFTEIPVHAPVHPGVGMAPKPKRKATEPAPAAGSTTSPACTAGTLTHNRHPLPVTIYLWMPVDDIIDIWRDMSKRGRYEGRLWRAEMLKTIFSPSPQEEGSAGAGASGAGSSGQGQGNGGGGGGAGSSGAGGSGAGGQGGEGFNADAEVDASNDSGYFARYGEAAPQRRGVHFGVHLGTQHVPAGGAAV